MTDLSRRLPRRPWTLWLISGVVAGIGFYNLVLALDHSRHAATYGALGLAYPIWLRVLTALAWGLLWLVWAAALLRRRPWARRWLGVAMSNYGAFGVLWLLAYSRSDFSRDRIAFQAALTALLVGLLVWVMGWQRVQAAFSAGSTVD